jgi:hypothetical protein
MTALAINSLLAAVTSALTAPSAKTSVGQNAKMPASDSPATVSIGSAVISARTSVSLSALLGSAISTAQNDRGNASSALSADENALKNLEQSAAAAKNTSKSTAEAKLQQLLQMYQKLVLMGNSAALAALAREIGEAAKELGATADVPDASASIDAQAAGALRLAMLGLLNLALLCRQHPPAHNQRPQQSQLPAKPLPPRRPMV